MTRDMTRDMTHDPPLQPGPAGAGGPGAAEPHGPRGRDGGGHQEAGDQPQEDGRRDRTGRAANIVCEC